jgi:Reverse transcriptase (RNA-dependent DNA polymerase)
MQLRGDVVAALDLPAALARLESQRGDFLPSSLAARAARQVAAAFVSRFEVLLESGINIQPADVVFAHRYGSGTRPVPDLSLEARLVVEALAKLLADRLVADADLLGLTPHLDSAAGQKLEFERRPLTDPKPAYVATADVASFYEYVDHDLLASEIVELTGDPGLASAVNTTLSEILGRRFGLPQGPHGSDIFASLYLSRVDRRLLRAGVALERFNDDYLIRADSIASAQRDVAALERSLRDLGLILNHQKTQVLTAEQYEHGLVAYQELLEAAAIDTIELPPGYTFDPDEFEGTSLESANEEIIAAAFERALDDEDHPFAARHRMIDSALPYLAGFENTLPLQRLAELIEVWPAHIRNVNLYLRRLVGTEHEQAVVGAVISALRTQTLALPWVQGWLVDVLARCTQADESFAAWLNDMGLTSSTPWFVRGRCLIALAQTDTFPEQETVGQLFEAAPAAARPDLIAAVQVAGTDWSEEFLATLATGDLLLKEVVDVVSTGPLRSVL